MSEAACEISAREQQILTHMMAEGAAGNSVDLSLVIRQVSVNLDTGMALRDAWGNSAESTEIYRYVTTLQQRVERPQALLMPHAGAAQKTYDTHAAGHEYQRPQSQQRKRRTGSSRTIPTIGEAQSRTQTTKTPPTVIRALTERWWRRSEEGQRYREGLRMLRIAWTFVEQVGAAPSPILNVAADAIDEATRAQQARKAAQAGPQASSKILAFLPLLGIGGAGFVGVNPWEFYFASALGIIDLCVGISLMLCGWAMTRRMVTHASQAGHYEYDSAFAMTLIQAGIESGASIPRTISALGNSMNVPALSLCGKELRQGKPWWDAWNPVPADFLPAAQILHAAWTHGSSPTTLLAHGTYMERVRRQRTIDIAHAKLAVRLMLPLGLCYLPAFIALGVIPVITHIATAI